VTLYTSYGCAGGVITTSLGSGCFNYSVSHTDITSVGTTSTAQLKVDLYHDASCAGLPSLGTYTTSDACSNVITNDDLLSYSVTIV
jgi:hypothetical protein